MTTLRTCYSEGRWALEHVAQIQREVDIARLLGTEISWRRQLAARLHATADRVAPPQRSTRSAYRQLTQP